MAEREVAQKKQHEAGKKTPSSGGTKTALKENVPPVGGTSESPRQSTESSKRKSSTTSATVTAPKEFNKELLLVIKELNSNVTAQNTRIEKQDKKLDELTSVINSWYEDESENFEFGQVEPPSAIDANIEVLSTYESDTEPPCKKQRQDSSSIFKSLTEKLQQHDLVDNEVNDDLSFFVNSSFKNGVSEDKVSEMIKDIHRPKNCEALTKTRVNQGIWRLLKIHTQTDDNRMQFIQNLVVKSAANIVKLIDKNSESLDTQDIEWGSNSIALLGQANKLINSRRKDMHKADLDPKYHYLASASLPFTDYLYGDDVDVNKNVREINDMNRIGRNLGRGYGRGFRGGRRSFRRGGYQSGGYSRGRGKYVARPDSSSSGSKNWKQAYKK